MNKHKDRRCEAIQLESNHQCQSEALPGVQYCELHEDIHYLLEARYKYFQYSRIQQLTDYALNQTLLLFPIRGYELTDRIAANTRKVWLQKIRLNAPADGICRGLDLHTMS